MSIEEIMANGGGSVKLFGEFSGKFAWFAFEDISEIDARGVFEVFEDGDS